MLPDLRARWVTPWIAVDWTKRAIRGLLYHIIRDMAFGFVFCAVFTLLGSSAGTAAGVIAVSWGAIMFETGQGVMLFRRHGEIHDGFLDPLDVLFSPLSSALGAFLALLLIAPWTAYFGFGEVLVMYGLYVVYLLPILVINLIRGTPPQLLTEE